MGSPLVPLLANVFMCHIENQPDQKIMIPPFYRRYVDYTLVTMPNKEISATDFLQALNNMNPSLSFTVELENTGSIPFLVTVLTRCGGTLTIDVYRKPTDKGLLLHFQSHFDSRYKEGVVNTMVNRTYLLSSTKEGFANNATSYAPCFQSCAIRNNGRFQHK